MPTYVPDAIEITEHIFSSKPQDAPSALIPPNFGKIIQHLELEDITKVLQQDEIARVQMIVGIFLYYALAIDNTQLPSLEDIAS